MSVTFKKNLVPIESLAGSACPICHKDFHTGSMTASHPEQIETQDHRITTVFVTIQVPLKIGRKKV